ncbi:hypothetical protein CCMA1212_002026 [Trichoderma ghanense]|uniref:Uncharacterized protein n=1 Tax=Trichoderma ghanense TaxID=65468 RepID=A0ABY2HFP0_9HYPO
MPEKLNPPLSEAPENDSWLWDWGIYTVPYPGQSKDFEVATIECWKYQEDEQGRTVPPIKKFQVRGFHTESMQSWLREPVPVVNGQQPSSGFKMVVMPSNPDLTREQTHSLNTILGLPNSRDHMSSDYSGACGMFEQTDGSHGSSSVTV